MDRVNTPSDCHYTGIAPGSGVETRGWAPARQRHSVIAIGVPTVVDAATMANIQ